MSNKIFSLIFVPIIAALVPYLACQFFDSPLLHGIFSADIFFLLIVMLLPRENYLWKLPFVILAFLPALYCDSFDGFILSGFYLLMFGVAAFVPRKKKFLLPIFAVLSSFIIVADCGIFFYSTFVLYISDIWGLAKFYWWGPLLFIAIPLLVVFCELFYARKILLGTERLEISHLVALIIIVLSVALNFGINKLQNRQPIMEFAVQKWFWQLCTPGIIGQNPYLQEDIKEAIPIWRKENDVISDFTKPTIMVLVESYGVNKSIDYTKALLAPFQNSNADFVGLYSRNAAHTQGAEWEDFGALGGSIYNQTVPQRFKVQGLQTWYLHGYSGNFYEREQNYGKFGFDTLLFKKDFEKRALVSCYYGFNGICDSSVVSFIDSLISDSIPKFIYWTTLDAHPPYELANISEKSNFCQTLSLSDIDCSYFTLQENTMKKLASLAAKHPNYRFIIRGDHRPMGSVKESKFVQTFYFRWVPLIVINGLK